MAQKNKPWMASEIENLKTASLVPSARNARTHSAEQIEEIAGSIRRFGWTNPVLVDASSGIIAGHGRVLAAERLGMRQVPCIRLAHLDAGEQRALMLADNRIALNAGWDESLLAAELQELGELGIHLDGLGFSDDELASFAAGPAGEPEAEPEEPHVEVIEGPASSIPGEIYELGPHRLVCGDCRDVEVVARLTDGRRVNLAFTSPPYASQREYDVASGFKPIAADAYVEWFDAVQRVVAGVLADDGSWFVNIKEAAEEGQRQLYVKDLTLAHVRIWGWMLIDEFCWTRGGVPGKWSNRFKNAWEPVFHFARGAQIKLRHENVTHATSDAIDYSPENTKNHSGFTSGSAGRRDGVALPSNVIHVHSGPRQIADDDTKHTATFPVGLPDFFVRAFTDEGDAVYDPFMGSGTTLIAAAQNGRVAYGCEISPAYCDLIRRRWTRWADRQGIAPGSGAL